MYNQYDPRLSTLKEVLDFFHDWENQHTDKKSARKHLITPQTRQDINSTIMGLLKVIESANGLGIPVNLGYMNGDLVENWFSQICSQRFGSNNHPTISQIGLAQNTNIIVVT